jgi:hypothetical protein
MCPFRIVPKIERSENAALDKLLVNCDYELAAIIGDQFSTRVVYPRPMRLRARAPSRMATIVFGSLLTATARIAATSVSPLQT